MFGRVACTDRAIAIDGATRQQAMLTATTRRLFVNIALRTLMARDRKLPGMTVRG